MTIQVNLTTYFAQQVIQAAGSQIPHLHPGATFISEHVLGSAYWNSLSPSRRKLAGKVLAEAVKRGLLPLIKGEPRSDNRRTYLLYSTQLDP